MISCTRRASLEFLNVWPHQTSRYSVVVIPTVSIEIDTQHAHLSQSRMRWRRLLQALYSRITLDFLRKGPSHTVCHKSKGQGKRQAKHDTADAVRLHPTDNNDQTRAVLPFDASPATLK